MATDKGFFFRLTPEVRAELEQAHWDTRVNRGEIFLQGFAIWLHAQRRGSLDKLLDAVGYQLERPLEPGTAHANGSAPGPGGPESEKPLGDGWDLDSAGAGS